VGTQPFKLLVVTNPQKRAEICEAASNQAQITDGSHLLVFAAWDTYTGSAYRRCDRAECSGAGRIADAERLL